MNDYLREYLNLTGTKFGCGIGVCSACVVILDNADGTLEHDPHLHHRRRRLRRQVGAHHRGHRQGRRARRAVQTAFLDHFAFQCGYCTPGFVNQAQVLVESLARAPVPKAEVEARILAAMDGHICRCTGYVRYYAALREVILADPKLTR